MSILLCYHAVSDSWPERFSVSTAQLRSHVEHLLGRGYAPTTFSDCVANPRHKCFGVTFDDGFRSVYERAFPLLSELGVPATLFVSTALTGSGEPLKIGYESWLDTEHADELAAASWDEVGTLAEGGWEIGSHTCSHPMLTKLDEPALSRELGESRLELEDRLGRPCRSIAYPFADVDARVVSATRAAGYEFAATVFGSFHEVHDPLRQPRVVLYRWDTFPRFRLKAIPALYRAVTSRPALAIRHGLKLRRSA